MDRDTFSEAFSLREVAPVSLPRELRVAYFAAGGRYVPAACYRITIAPGRHRALRVAGCAHAVVVGDRIGIARQGPATWGRHRGDVAAAVDDWLNDPAAWRARAG